jgi:hypothetical protein
MSIDLQRPLVASMGQQDPLDGLVTCLQLQAHRVPGSDAPDLEPQIRALTSLVAGIDPGSDDPLGIGGLLVDAWKLLQLPETGGNAKLAARLLDAAADGLDAWLVQRPLDQPVTSAWRSASSDARSACMRSHAFTPCPTADSAPACSGSWRGCRWPLRSRRPGCSRGSNARPAGWRTTTSMR